MTMTAAVTTPSTPMTAATLLEVTAAERVRVSVHDASRLAWDFRVPLPENRSADYDFQLELEVPTDILAVIDPWSSLQSYARLGVGGDESITAASGPPEAFRRQIVALSAKLAHVRDGFVRHCTLIRSSASLEDKHARALALWVDGAGSTLANARSGLLSGQPHDDLDERRLADEYLSIQHWTALTDCARSLFDTRRALAERSERDSQRLDAVEAHLADALTREIAYRRRARFAQPANELQLERLLARMQWLKKHFERVLFLDTETYQVVARLGAWFSALGAVLAYLWFFVWQLVIERRQGPGTVGSGIAVFAVLTAIVYASRERLKELGRNWIAGRVQRYFAQRVTRYRLSGSGGRRGALVAAARESFSQSRAPRPDPRDHDAENQRDVTVLRFTHRGRVSQPATSDARAVGEIRFSFRFDLSPLFPRLHDALRGFATPEPGTDRIAILDVPRNYELPVRWVLRAGGENEHDCRHLVLNKNGLVRLEDACT